MFVAMTRARHHLAVLYPLHSYGSRWGSEYSIDQLSRSRLGHQLGRVNG